MFVTMLVEIVGILEGKHFGTGGNLTKTETPTVKP